MIISLLAMKIAVEANVKTCKEACKGYTAAFDVAYKGGCVLGFTASGIGLFTMLLLILIFRQFYLPARPTFEMYELMFEKLSGFALGASVIALFSRVGGGIFTKAADVGSDLVGKVIVGLEEDSILNPGVIADCVGDNVGDIAGIGADLYGSFIEALCASLVIGAHSKQIVFSVNAFYFYPLMVLSTGVLISIITSLALLGCMRPTTPEELTRH